VRSTKVRKTSRRRVMFNYPQGGKKKLHAERALLHFRFEGDCCCSEFSLETKKEGDPIRKQRGSTRNQFISPVGHGEALWKEKSLEVVASRRGCSLLETTEVAATVRGHLGCPLLLVPSTGRRSLFSLFSRTGSIFP